MSNVEKLNDVFVSTFEVEESLVPTLAYKTISMWDSVGQMSLIVNLEDAFDIMIQSEDIMDCKSYESVKSILSEKYGVLFE